MPTKPAASPPLDRRPLASRSTRWARFLAARLASTPITPNQISLFSVACAAAGATLIGFGDTWFAFVVAAVFVQLRLLCNLLDGMVAIEGGKSSAVGALYNEIPDRIADSLFLVPLGYAAGWPWLGWAAALVAALTAYIRVLGGTLGQQQDFSGVMAKQRRMAALTAALIAQAIETAIWGTRWALLVAGLVILAGSIVTCATRIAAIARRLQIA